MVGSFRALWKELRRPKSKEPTSWQYFSDWRTLIHGSKARPFTPLIVQVLLEVAMSLRRYDLYVVMYLAFSCLLRTMEFVSLKPENIVVYALRGCGALLLQDTKTIKRKRVFEEQWASTIPFWLPR